MIAKRYLGRLALALCTVWTLLPLNVLGQEAPAALRPPLPLASSPAPLASAKNLGLEPLVTMIRAEIGVPEEIEGIRQWNAAGRKPMKVGFFRSLPVPQEISLGAQYLEQIEGNEGEEPQRADGALGTLNPGVFRQTEEGLVWAGQVKVEGAWGFRARLSGVRMPAGTELWVYGESGESGETQAFGLELLRSDGVLWTPAVGGEILNLEIRVPTQALDAGGSLTFALDQVAQIFQLDGQGAPRVGGDLPPKFCTEGAACWSSPNPDFDLLKQATAYMEIVTSNGVGLCSGTLMNTTQNSFLPYLLTANHCLGNANDARSTSFYFDFIPSTCGGSDPFLFSLPRVNGAALLTTRPASDSSFLLLSSSPSGFRGFAGWTTVAPTEGQQLNSLSHPGGRSMRYSRTVVRRGAGCGFSTNDYVFSDQEVGGVQGGSSGSSAFTNDYRVVGQLRGACGSDPSNGCFWNLNDRFDGRFSAFFPSIRQFLDADVSSCVENETTLCLNGGRFRVRANYTAPRGGAGSGHGVQLTDDTGYFWFFQASNVEVVVKVLAACGANNHYWVFAGGLTNLGVSLSVLDTQTGREWAGLNPLGQTFLTIADTMALSCN